MSRIAIVFGIVCAACSVDVDVETAGQSVQTVDVYQDAAGAFSPFSYGARTGDTITWHFQAPTPGNAVARRVYVPGSPGTYAIAPYTPSLANEFVGPMIQAPSGVFALGPTAYGMAKQGTPCTPPTTYPLARRVVGATTEYLCRTTDLARYQRTMDSTWEDPDITGVFIRLQWKDLQPTMTSWNDDVLVAEADAAVAHGKLYSIVIESGRDGQPPWLLDPVASGGAGLTGYLLDSNDEPSVTGCRPEDMATYADPTTPTYRQLYKAALTHVANVLQANSARYRALAYIKPSGANRGTGENRLPSRCKGCSCNNRVWAEQAHYKPSKLYAYYADQIAHIAQQFPGKSMSYMLIQAGFPRVGQDHCYEDALGAVVCPPAAVDLTIPTGTEQTEHIINAALASLPVGTFVVEHQGLDMALGSVNPWVTSAGTTYGTPTMFQTSAGGQVGSPADVGSTIENLWNNSAASAIEIYEERLWEANGAALTGVLGPYGSYTIGTWNTQLHARRRTSYPSLGDPAPTTYSFTWRTPIVQPLPPPNDFEYNAYVDPRRQPVTQAAGCLDGFSPCVVVRL
jgi:hypothetical protein